MKTSVGVRNAFLDAQRRPMTSGSDRARVDVVVESMLDLVRSGAYRERDVVLPQAPVPVDQAFFDLLDLAATVAAAAGSEVISIPHLTRAIAQERPALMPDDVLVALTSVTDDIESEDQVVIQSASIRGEKRVEQRPEPPQ